MSFEYYSYLRQRHFGRYSDENYELVNKVYDCLRHNVMVTKLDAYSLTTESLHIISDSLSYRKQRTKIGLTLFAEFLKTLYWDLYFSLFLLMLFFLSLKSQTFITLYNTLFSHGTNLPLILNDLEHDMRNLFMGSKLIHLEPRLHSFIY